MCRRICVIRLLHRRRVTNRWTIAAHAEMTSGAVREMRALRPATGGLMGGLEGAMALATLDSAVEATAAATLDSAVAAIVVATLDSAVVAIVAAHSVDPRARRRNSARSAAQ